MFATTKEFYLDWLEQTPSEQIADTSLITYYEKKEADVIAHSAEGESIHLNQYKKHRMSPFFFSLICKKYDLCRKLLSEGKIGSTIYERVDVLDGGEELQEKLCTAIHRYFLIDISIPKDISDRFWDIQIKELNALKKTRKTYDYIMPLEYMSDTKLLYEFCEGVDVCDYKQFYHMHLQLLETFLQDHDDIGEVFSLKNTDLYRYGMRAAYDRFDINYVMQEDFSRFVDAHITDIQMRLLEILFHYHKRNKTRLQKLITIMPISGIGEFGPHSYDKEEYINRLLVQVKRMSKAYEVDKIRKKHFFIYLFEIAVCIKSFVSPAVQQEFFKLAKQFYIPEIEAEDILLIKRDDYGYSFPLHTAIRSLEGITNKKVDLCLRKKKHRRWFEKSIQDICYIYWDGFANRCHVNEEELNRIKVWLAELQSITYEGDCPYSWRRVLDMKNSELLRLLLQKGMFPMNQITETINYCMENKLNQVVPLLLLYQTKEC